jgi:hypothetical protein
MSLTGAGRLAERRLRQLGRPLAAVELLDWLERQGVSPGRASEAVACGVSAGRLAVVEDSFGKPFIRLIHTHQEGRTA